MAPDVLLRKLTYLRQLLMDLAPSEGATLATVQAEHYFVAIFEAVLDEEGES
ncbi:MAG TPA: hypothetical protein VF177_19035 [Anaerolineae bacterium]